LLWQHCYLDTADWKFGKKNPPAFAGGFWSFNGGWDAI
jgi:hypothetical protein